jgi:hypothetical protein
VLSSVVIGSFFRFNGYYDCNKVIEELSKPYF